MPTSFSPLKTATKPNLENQPPYAAVSVRTEPQHMVVFLTFEIVSLPLGMKNPRFSNRGGSFLVWCSSACTNMGQQACAAWQVLRLFRHGMPPPKDRFGYYTMTDGFRRSKNRCFSRERGIVCPLPPHPIAENAGRHPDLSCDHLLFAGFVLS